MVQHATPSRSSARRSAIVVGSGIAGAATAFALARRGVTVTIIDDGAVGQATAASAGIIQPWSSNVDGPFADLYMAGAAFWPTVLEHLADVDVDRTDYRRSGALAVHADDALLAATLDRVRSRVPTSGPLAGAVERIDGRAARERFPPLAEGLDAVWIEGGARVDGRTARDAFLLGAARLGATRVVGHATLRTGPSADRSVDVDGTRYSADDVVVATGAWSSTVLAAAGLEVPVAPQRGQITHLRLEGVDTAPWPTVHPLSHHYLVAFDDARVAVGATRETGSGFDPRVTAAGQLQVLRDALSIAPGLADATVIETRVGLRPVVDGSMPVVGPVPGRPGLHVATGYGAAGLTMGPLLGDALARSVLDEDAPELTHTAPRSA
jgi:D-amino-acid dehydrogenase